ASVIGMHFFNPAPVMKLVEVVTTATTDPAIDETTRALCDKLGKVAVSCGDRAGFIVNALLFPYLNDAVKMLEAGRADMATIDAAIKEQVKFPLAPFELLDVVGNDVSLAIQKELHAESKHAGVAAAPVLEHGVAAGRLGRKTKRGFHDCNRPHQPARPGSGRGARGGFAMSGAGPCWSCQGWSGQRRSATK